MHSPLRVLHLEDNSTDAELVRATLEAEAIQSELTRVEAEPEFVAALKPGDFDIILADYTLPSFDGLSALKLAQERLPDVPFIFVSGTLGEDVAIEALKTGATDYILKTRLTRLGPAVTRALGEAREKAERQHAEALLAGEKRLLEMVARGDSLPRTLDELCRLVETQCPGVLASVLLMDANGKQLRHGAAPSLPKAYTDAIDGAFIGPRVGSCGTAAFTHQQVIVSDIATDPLWADFRDLALAHSLRACWSTPIFSSEDEVLGTFAFYYREPRSPEPREQDIIEQITHIAGVAIQRKSAEEALRRSEGFLADGQRISHTGSWSWNVSTGEVTWSEEHFRIFGYDPEKTESSYQLFLETVHPDDRSFIQQELDKAIREKSGFDLEFRIALADGSIKQVQGVGRPNLGKSGEVDYYIGTTADITERKRGEALFAGEKRLLEMIATGAALSEILKTLCLIIEEYRSGTLASILLLQSDGLHLDSVAGPSLPKAWTRQMEKLPIGPCAGSCGTAAYRGTPVIVSDIATDPLWELPEHRESALRHGFRASWSNPILSSKGKVLGTFCIYHRETRSPSSHDLELMEKATDLARVAIERDRAEEALRNSEEKYRDLINASPDAIFVTDLGGKLALLNPAGVELIGRPEEELIGSLMIDTYVPEELHLAERRTALLETGGSLRYERKFVRGNGEVIPVDVSVSSLHGKYFQAVIRDISERKRAEEALRASEQVARGQVEALTYSLDVLATAPAPDKFLGQMLSTIGRLLDAQSVILWLINETTDSLDFRALAQGAKLASADPEHPFVKDPLAWKTDKLMQEAIFTAAPVICEDIEHDPRVSPELRKFFASRGTRKHLTIPTLAGGRVRGFIGVRHDARPRYRPEEIELAQALAHQAMLAIQLTDLAEQGRRAAILGERNRMARDIHDTLAQGFTGVIVQLEAVADAISSSDHKEAESYLRRASELARQSLNEARRSVHALRPEALRDSNFWDALKGIIKNTTAGNAICTRTRLRGKLPNLPNEWQQNLMHIGQEALTNTLKYAHADNFETRLACNDKELRLQFKDDGDGFRLREGHDGFGLAGMRERVEQMGGELKITSARGKGTTVSVILPLNGESKS